MQWHQRQLLHHPCTSSDATAFACCTGKSQMHDCLPLLLLLQAGERGGAIFLSNVQPAHISACNISDSEAAEGGAIGSQYGSMLITNGTIISRAQVCVASPRELGPT